MKKPFRETELWKWVRTIFQMIGIALMVIAIIMLFRTLGISEAFSEGWDEHENEYYEYYVICKPGDYVNIRTKASSRSESCGYLESCDRIYSDGKVRNGFIHIIYATNETGEGWVYKGYIVDNEPEYLNQRAVIVSKGRLAARKYVDGKRTKWLKPSATVTVYYWSDLWCVTNCGFVQSRYLELEGE